MAKTLEEKIEQLRNKLEQIKLLGQFELNLNKVTSEKDFSEMIQNIFLFCKKNKIQIIDADFITIENDYDASHPYPDFNPAE